MLLQRRVLQRRAPASEPETVRGTALAPRMRLLAAGALWQTVATGIVVFFGDNPRDDILNCLGFAVGLALLLAALLRPAPWPSPAKASSRWLARVTGRGIVVALALAAALTLLLTAGLLSQANSPRIYESDAAAFNAYNAELVLHGVNPYSADDRFWDAIRRFPSVGATPLRRGRYAQSRLGPSLSQLVVDVRSELAHPSARGPEFAPASLHSYPALAFLVYVPGVWLGLGTTMLTSLLFTLAFLLAAGWRAPRGVRLPVTLVLFGSGWLVFFMLRGSFEGVALLPAVLAWRLLDRRWLSPALLGLACAVKQIAWPLVPFYLISIWRRDGARAALQRLPWLAGAFLLPNLPFLVASPRAWATSLLLPVSLPIFPSGIGLIALGQTGVLPLWPPAVYAFLELLALAALLLWWARARPLPQSELALVLGLLPLLFAWHSLASYFAVLPALAVYAALPLLRRDLAVVPQT